MFLFVLMKRLVFLEKLEVLKKESFINIVSSRKPFGISTNIKIQEKKSSNSIKIYAYPKDGYINIEKVSTNKDSINKWKVLIAKAYGERGNFPYLVIGKPFIGEPYTCCSETYLLIGPYNNEIYCENIITYMKSRFFRLFVLLKKNTQNAAKGVYQFVPMQDFSEPWTDEKLYKKYGLNEEEIAL